MPSATLLEGVFSSYANTTSADAGSFRDGRSGRGRSDRLPRRFYHLPVMFLTVLRDDESFVKSINAYADAYLNKPFEPGELKGTIERLICSSPSA